MAQIYIVRHASPAIRPDTDPREWTLSERGIAEAGVLAGTAEGWGIEALYSSTEPKARSTALIIGDALGLNVNQSDAFDELRMPSGWIGNSDEFNEMVRGILEEPDASVHGSERAAAAAERFAEGVALVLGGPTPAAIVSHGRVISAYVSGMASVEDDAFDFWRSIPMPGWCVVEAERGKTSRLVRGFQP
jgi:broad specificity phosphatase PhoE